LLNSAKLPGVTGKKTLEDLLTFRNIPLNYNVIKRMRTRFGVKVIQAVNEQNPELAEDTYNDALALPQTLTEDSLQIDGIQLNGEWIPGVESISICFKGTIPHLLKVLNVKETNRSAAFNLVLNGQKHPHLTPFELKSAGTKVFMLMPIYSTTLEHIKILSVEDGRKLLEQIGNDLRFIHSIEFVHMDVKSSNICLDSLGNYVLIDLGSITQKNEVSESTVAYVPIDFQPRSRAEHSNKYKSQFVCDWLMLGMTLAEKVYCLEIGRVNPTVEGLFKILKDYPEYPSIVKPLL
jgi:serine/threonine protein kinase